MSDLRPEDFGPRGAVLAMQMVGQILAGVVVVPFLIGSVLVAHLLGADWAGISASNSAGGVIMISLMTSVLYTLGAWFVISGGDGRGVILSAGQVFWLTVASSTVVASAWYALVATRHARGLLIGALVGATFAVLVHLWTTAARRREAELSEDDKAERAAKMKVLFRRTFLEGDRPE